jgi:hypothetical protein
MINKKYYFNIFSSKKHLKNNLNFKLSKDLERFFCKIKSIKFTSEEKYNSVAINK